VSREDGAYKANEAVDVPVLADGCDKAACYRFAATTTFWCIHPEVVVTGTNTGPCNTVSITARQISHLL